MKSKFIEIWLGAGGSESGGSRSSAECVIEKYEERPVPKGKALAEMVGFQLALVNHFPLNSLSRKYARECHSNDRLTRR